MRELETEHDITPTYKLLENAIEGIQNKLAKLNIAAFQSDPGIATRITACEEAIRTNVNILKEIKGQL